MRCFCIQLFFQQLNFFFEVVEFSLQQIPCIDSRGRVILKNLLGNVSLSNLLTILKNTGYLALLEKFSRI